MNENTRTLIAAAVPTIAVIGGFLRNEFALSGLARRIAGIEGRITAAETRLDARIETLTRDINQRFETLIQRIEKVDADLREWARITMKHNTDVARLKDKVGLSGE